MAGRGHMPRTARAAPLVVLLTAARASDIKSCKLLPSFTVWRCPHGTAFACWSSEPYAPWACWSKDQVPRWAQLTPHDTCQRWPAPPGAGAAYYNGACAFFFMGAEPAPQPVPVAWDEAYEAADATLARMEAGEKFSLMHGIGWDDFDLRKWWYVGNVAAIPRLGLPSINMQDASGGFRTYWSELEGTVTCWPSLLALAATWDPSLVRTFGEALATEFAGKGANTILGPSVNVHRVARNGRNFEYLSGEDPYLGSRMAEAYVQGVQSQGVLAVVKHWVFNEQETHRLSESSVADEKTSWELYYPPFEAAVNAGVSVAMCAYNRVDGMYACSNGERIRRDLKQRMGFRGFVVSDWWAMDRASVAQGVDQEMPSSKFFSPETLSQAQERDVDDAARRVLAAIYRSNLSSSTKCTPPACKPWFMRNVTGPAHTALARTIAAESIVLLRNEGDTLPLGVRSLAVVGTASVAQAYSPNGADQGEGQWWWGDYYAGGGSGHVAAGYVVTPLQGIIDRANATGVRVVSAPTNDPDKALEAAAEADVCVIVAATTSGESVDRTDLHLDHGADKLIAAVAATGKRTVVLVQAPGAVVMPWRESVAAIMLMFLGGQETGTAWADVLFGEHTPTGRLPLMIPETEADTVKPESNTTVEYTEGMATSYRNKAFRAAYPFGHGLTYSHFKYGPLRSVSCQDYQLCVHVEVSNAGKVAARTVAQLYLELPPEAQHPVPLLKGFRRTRQLAPGESEELIFGLTERDVSYYCQGNWIKAERGVAHVGESSADLRQKLKFEAPGDSLSSHSQGLIATLCALALGCGFCCKARASGSMREPWARGGAGLLALSEARVQNNLEEI